MKLGERLSLPTQLDLLLIGAYLIGFASLAASGVAVLAWDIERGASLGSPSIRLLFLCAF